MFSSLKDSSGVALA
ncbi:hypothetical protein A2U01_0104236 [Trifolium medium]|uniref:Uncharacterized protein n=1 Tax=Trifolium medium TaxID=97028 RepID=A0A392V683_9FABA|nr:hypothetical protein [Trifolium medium]